MAEAGLEAPGLRLSLFHTPLDLVNVSSLGSDGVESKLLGSPFGQPLAVALGAVNDEHLGLLVQFGQGHLQLPFPAMRGKVKPFNLSVNGAGLTVNHESS